jgi:hypothetical protein
MAGLLVVLLMLCGPVMPLAAASPRDGPGGVGETDGASALRWWFRTDAGVYADFDCTTLASTGGLVACWVDQSGHGEMVRQSDTEYQPVYRTTSRLEFDTAILSSTQVVQLFTNPSAGLSAIVVFNTSNYSETAVLVNHGASYGVNTDENFELGYTVGNTSQWGNFGLHRGDGNATVAAQDTIHQQCFDVDEHPGFDIGNCPTQQSSDLQKWCGCVFSYRGQRLVGDRRLCH